MERKLPIGVQSFENLRTNHYLYVDKTEYIWKITNEGKAYFLSRPRRFGKSLLSSTIAAYFEGKKELFKGLAIEKYENEKGEKAWQKYPVIYFSLASGSFNEEDGLKQKLNAILLPYEKKYCINSNEVDLPNRFANLIATMAETTCRQVVVLVDEYDKPLLETMSSNKGQEEKNRELYKSFFSVLKDEDQYLKFVFITGVTKFSKVSIFSDLNQLNDISLNDAYSAICGITEEELKNTFKPEIEKLAEENEQSTKEALVHLAKMYDGYHFSKKGIGVYNPFSLLNAFYNKDYGSYWYATGTPTFLVRSLESSNFTAEEFTDGVDSKEAEMTDYRADNPNPIPLFYQSGYLTICGYDKEFRIYSLRFPNEEVKYGFLNSLAPSVLGRQDSQNPVPIRDMVLALRRGDIETFVKWLESMFAKIPYEEGRQHSYEQEWRNEVFLILELLGQNTQAEVHTSSGRADCIVETKEYVYLFEYKLDKSAEEALKQIEERGYGEPYQADKRKLYKIGISFSSAKRNIVDWKVK